MKRVVAATVVMGFVFFMLFLASDFAGAAGKAEKKGIMVKENETMMKDEGTMKKEGETMMKEEGTMGTKSDKMMKEEGTMKKEGGMMK